MKKVLVIVAMALLAAAGFIAGVGWQASRPASPEEGSPTSSFQAEEDPDREGTARLPDLDKMTGEEKEAYFAQIVDDEVQKFVDQIERKTDD